MEYIRLRGMAVSPGVAQGKVHLTERIIFTSRKETISPDLIEKELERLDRSVKRTKTQLVEIKSGIEKKIGEEHAFIFEAHLMILEDDALMNGVKSIIEKEGVRAEWAISRTHDKYTQIFETIEDDYIRQRQSDVSDVLSKIYTNLAPTVSKEREIDGEKILVAHDLLPSEAATCFSRGDILAVALEMGGQTSHTAILARSMNIPAVVGLRNITQIVKTGDNLIVDGTAGEVIINPAATTCREFDSKKKKYDDYQKELRKTAILESVTLDGFQFYPMANIE
ncbi:MAG: PEP-utilizing enzyme, partial [Candidatus Aminicenantes bacterium]|nr:PEP-utilizing enzyme [Candidatus Aminicenantes bacterium]